MGWTKPTRDHATTHQVHQLDLSQPVDAGSSWTARSAQASVIASGFFRAVMITLDMPGANEAG